MAHSLTISSRNYPSQGRCIFCLQHFDLEADPPVVPTTEHVIPYALSKDGEITIRDGSCKGCNDSANARFEHRALQTDLKPPRVFLELKRRKRPPSKRQPLLLGRVAPGKILGGGSEDKFEQVPNEQLPRVFHLFIFEPAGFIAGTTKSGELASYNLYTIFLGRHDTAMSGTFTVETKSDHTAYSLTLAKIAYTHAVTQLGLGGFDGRDIRDLLSGVRSDTYNFVGGLSLLEQLNTSELHKLYVRRRGDYFTVIVHLFASFGLPPYEIAVGRRTTH